MSQPCRVRGKKRERIARMANSPRRSDNQCCRGNLGGKTLGQRGLAGARACACASGCGGGSLNKDKG